MSPRIISEEIALEGQGEELVFTEGRLRAHPLTTSLAIDFTALLDTEWTSLVQQRWQLLFDILRAEAKAWHVDLQLDAFVDKFHPVLLRAVNNDTNDARYTRLMKGKRPFELKRPILKGQMAIMKNWPSILSEQAYAGFADLLAMKAELEGLLTLAVAAETTLEEAQNKDKNFRKVGARPAFTGKLNALRQATAGKLKEMVHTLPGASLPNDFPDWFFLKSNRSDEKKAPTSEELDTAIKAMEIELEALRGKYAEALQAEKTEAAKENERAEKEAKLAQARQRQKEAAAEAAALEAELSKR